MIFFSYTRSITNLPALDSPRHSNQAPSDISRASNESSQAEVLRDYMWQVCLLSVHLFGVHAMHGNTFRNKVP